MSDKNDRSVMDELAECLDIPETAYEKAEARYKDLGEWFSRPEAFCASYNPHIYPQGSFRLGTVTNAEEFDLDCGCRLTVGITKATHSQRQLKTFVQYDLEAYRHARRIEQRLEEKHRCWRLRYKDELAFHLDMVPSVPEEGQRRLLLKSAMVGNGIDRDLADRVTSHAGAITDNRLPSFGMVSPDWKVSNSEGYAEWFESRMKLASELMQSRAVAAKFARVDDLPAAKWKSPLQRSVQILKCHRNRMFEDHPEVAPISIIVTTLAAQAYQGEVVVSDALEGILSRMGDMVRAERPRVPNPVNPVEDFADKWYDREHRHLNLEENFWRWLDQAKIDFELISESRDPDFISEQARTKFGATLSASSLRSKLGLSAATVYAAPRVHTITETPARPWLLG